MVGTQDTSQDDTGAVGAEVKAPTERTSATLPSPPKRVLLRFPHARLGLLAVLGPGLIAAMAGDDAGGIATYASVGADYGFSLLWALVIITISLALIQEMAGRMGAVTGKGFAELVRERFGVRPTAFVMATLVIANAGLVVSEFAGIGAAAELFGISRYIAVPPMAALLWWLVTNGSYRRVQNIFLVLTLAFIAYPIAAFLAGPSWGEVGRQIVRPTFHLDSSYLTLFIALVGTTITPYMQLYIQSAVAEQGPSADITGAKVDAYVGSVISDMVAGFIIIATGATLFVVGAHVQTAEDAARALEPFAGKYATIVFGLGLFGASMLAAGVLPLATAYSVTEAFGFEKGISRTFREAPIFLGLFTGLIAVGAAIALIPGINVITLLVSTQVINGMLLPIVLITILLLVNDRELMGKRVNGRLYNAISWFTVGSVVLLSTIYLVITLVGLFGFRVG
ncbi:MAG: NRAMP family divalent metal transporter [Thermomicrobiales bacterium]